MGWAIRSKKLLLFSILLVVGFVALGLWVFLFNNSSEFKVNYDNRFELTGCSLDKQLVHQGETLLVNIDWKPVRYLSDYFSKKNPDLIKSESVLLYLSGPISKVYTLYIDSGNLAALQYSISINSTIPPGIYRVEFKAGYPNPIPIVESTLPVVKDHLQLGFIDVRNPGKETISETFRESQFEYRLKSLPENVIPKNLPVMDFAELSGVSYANENLRPGDTTWIEFYWKSLKKTDKNYIVFTHFDHQTTGYRMAMDHPPVQGIYPTSSWKPGEYIREGREWVIPKDATTGQYFLYVGMTDPLQGGKASPHIPIDILTVGSVVPDIYSSRPDDQVQISLNKSFGGILKLSGISLQNTALKRGMGSSIDLFWESQTPSSHKYSANLHLYNPKTYQRLNLDHGIASQSPVSSWRKGDFYKEQVKFTAPPKFTPGTYQILLRVQDTSTGKVVSPPFSLKGLIKRNHGWLEIGELNITE